MSGNSTALVLGRGAQIRSVGQPPPAFGAVDRNVNDHGCGEKDARYESGDREQSAVCDLCGGMEARGFAERERYRGALPLGEKCAAAPREGRSPAGNSRGTMVDHRRPWMLCMILPVMCHVRSSRPA